MQELVYIFIPSAQIYTSKSRANRALELDMDMDTLDMDMVMWMANGQ